MSNHIDKPITPVLDINFDKLLKSEKEEDTCNDQIYDSTQPEEQCSTKMDSSIGAGYFGSVSPCCVHENRVIKHLKNADYGILQTEFENLKLVYSNKGYTTEPFEIIKNQNLEGIEMEDMGQNYATLEKLFNNPLFNLSNEYIQQIVVSLLIVLDDINIKKSIIHGDLNEGNIFVNIKTLNELAKEYQEKFPLVQQTGKFFTEKYVDLVMNSKYRSPVVLGDFAFSFQFEKGKTTCKDFKNGNRAFSSPEIVSRSSDCFIQDNEEVYGVGILLLKMFLESGAYRSKSLSTNAINCYKDGPMVITTELDEHLPTMSLQNGFIIKVKDQCDYKYIAVENHLKPIINQIIKMTQKSRPNPSEILKSIESFSADTPTITSTTPTSSSNGYSYDKTEPPTTTSKPTNDCKVCFHHSNDMDIQITNGVDMYFWTNPTTTGKSNYI